MAKKERTVALSKSSKSKLIPSVTAQNEDQKVLMRAMANSNNAIVIVDGIAGTGKTYCAVSWGLEQFSKQKYQKMVFSRPVVEAGEKLGYLPDWGLRRETCSLHDSYI